MGSIRRWEKSVRDLAGEVAALDFNVVYDGTYMLKPTVFPDL